VQVALSEIVQAVGTGQLDHRAAGKMLYAIQQATSLIKYRAKLEAAQAEAMNDANDHSQAGQNARVQEYPGFEQEFGLNPGSDIDAETGWTLRKADEEVELRHVNDLPAPPPGMRLGSPQYRVYREEAYQALNVQLNYLQRELRDYHEMKRQEVEKLKKEMLSVAPSSERLANSA
jgi:hypothetical protein